MLLLVFLIFILTAANTNISISQDNWFQSLLIKVTILKLTDEPVCITGLKGPCKDSPDGQRIMNGCHGNAICHQKCGRSWTCKFDPCPGCLGCCPGILTPCSRIYGDASQLVNLRDVTNTSLIEIIRSIILVWLLSKTFLTWGALCPV